MLFQLIRRVKSAVPTWFLRSAERFVLVPEVFGIPESEVQLHRQGEWGSREGTRVSAVTVQLWRDEGAKRPRHAHQN